MKYLKELMCGISDSPLGGLGIRAPFTIPSGVVTTAPSVLARMARIIPQLGFLTTKTLSLDPREGYREPIIYEYSPRCYANAVGLANPGARAFLEAMAPHLPLHDNKPLVVSIMGGDPEEFLECARVLDPIADAFELNLSCPHVKGAGQSVGADTEMVVKIVRLLRRELNKPIIPKLSANLPDVAGTAHLCEEAGAAAFSLINTVGPGTPVDCDGNPVLSNEVGGLSGAGILPIGIRTVREAASVVMRPIIASGGIGCINDVIGYYAAGARLFGIGSVLGGCDEDQVRLFFSRLQEDLFRDRGVDSFVYYRDQTDTGYRKTEVTEVIHHSHDLCELRLKTSAWCGSGQFFFVRLPGVGEKPFMPSSLSPLGFLIRRVGPFTAALSTLAAGDSVFVRGGYGKGTPYQFEEEEEDDGSFEEESPAIVVAGGTGIACFLARARSRGPGKMLCFFGFSQEPGRALREQILEAIPNARIIVDPPGSPGAVVRAFIDYCRAHEPLDPKTIVTASGPRPMNEAVVAAAEKFFPRKAIYVNREDVMKCGIGLCGSCGTPGGRRSCVDGPIMRLDRQ
jgi:dihydroorotate dehydrogenase (NAD+) catalytic subunit